MLSILPIGSSREAISLKPLESWTILLSFKVSLSIRAAERPFSFACLISF